METKTADYIDRDGALWVGHTLRGWGTLEDADGERFSHEWVEARFGPLEEAQ